MTPDSVTIGDHTSVNDKVVDIQITDFGDFIQNMEPDYNNEYFYFDTRLRTYWGYLWIIYFVCFYDLSFEFWNYSDSVVLLVF
jgi:hypothetical protein